MNDKARSWSDFVVRPIRQEDLPGLKELAVLSGGGLLNLPNDIDALQEKLDASLTAFDRDLSAPDNEYYLFVLEQLSTGLIAGTTSIKSRIGVKWPYYSYKLNTVTHFSRELDRMVPVKLLTLVNDLGGASEVGGLFLHPEARGTGLGPLLARSRYLFVAEHPERFSDIMTAEIRGALLDGQSPFWNALGRVFFGQEFSEADLYNALNGNQFIADLMPKYPIYVDLLPEAARNVIGRPHEESAPAQRMLLREGFRFENYIDIFDGGPALTVRKDDLAAIREGQMLTLADGDPGEKARKGMVGSGHLNDFRAWLTLAHVEDDLLRSAGTPVAARTGSQIRWAPA